MGVNSIAVFYSGAFSSDDSLIKCKRAAGGLAAAVSKEGGDEISHPPRAKASDMRDVRCVPGPLATNPAGRFRPPVQAYAGLPSATRSGWLHQVKHGGWLGRGRSEVRGLQGTIERGLSDTHCPRNGTGRVSTPDECARVLNLCNGQRRPPPKANSALFRCLDSCLRPLDN
jgi:hypothetical protein